MDGIIFPILQIKELGPLPKVTQLVSGANNVPRYCPDAHLQRTERAGAFPAMHTPASVYTGDPGTCLSFPHSLRRWGKEGTLASHFP